MAKPFLLSEQCFLKSWRRVLTGGTVLLTLGERLDVPQDQLLDHSQ
jgi:hypothetical protein